MCAIGPTWQLRQVYYTSVNLRLKIYSVYSKINLNTGNYTIKISAFIRIHDLFEAACQSQKSFCRPK